MSFMNFDKLSYSLSPKEDDSMKLILIVVSNRILIKAIHFIFSVVYETNLSIGTS